MAVFLRIPVNVDADVVFDGGGDEAVETCQLFAGRRSEAFTSPSSDHVKDKTPTAAAARRSWRQLDAN
jgi:hypothetical protein